MQTRITATDWRNRTTTTAIADNEPDGEPLDPKEKERRGTYWRRTMRVSELLMGTVGGFTVRELAHRVNERMGTDYNPRTIQRDVSLLESLGLADRDSRGIVRWCPNHHALVRTVLSSVTMPDPDRAPRRPAADDHADTEARRPGAMQSAIDQLPPPWQLSERQMRAANEAARILAMIDHGDTAWVDAVLVFQLGVGWQLRRPGTDAPSRYAFVSAISCEEQIERAEEAIVGLLQDDWDAFDDERWEPVDSEPRDLRRVAR